MIINIQKCAALICCKTLLNCARCVVDEQICQGLADLSVSGNHISSISEMMTENKTLALYSQCIYKEIYQNTKKRNF